MLTMNTDLTQEQYLLAVVIPSYNRPDLLVEALISLQEQTYTNWRAIIVNDASTVDYTELKNRFENDPRIRFVRREVNGGVNQACNTGLDYLAKENGIAFIAIMDDDDVYAPDYFDEAVKMMRLYPEYSWFMSNNFGDQKKSSTTITKEGELDYVDDYIYGKFRGDKGRLIAAWILIDLRFDGRFRSSHRWVFFTDIAQHTKIWAFPHNSIQKRYMEGGITKAVKRPKTLMDIYYSFYKHWHVIRLRPKKLAAYKYFFMELCKAPARIIRRWIYLLQM